MFLLIRKLKLLSKKRRKRIRKKRKSRKLFKKAVSKRPVLVKKNSCN
jgi:hypothetical protein